MKKTSKKNKPKKNNKKTRLQEVRESLGYSQLYVANQTAIPRTTLRRMETGTSALISRHYARALYFFYNKEVELGEIYDPMFKFETKGRR